MNVSILDKVSTILKNEMKKKEFLQVLDEREMSQLDSGYDRRQVDILYI